MNNFRILLNKIKDIVSNTTKEDIKKAIDNIERCDKSKDKYKS